MLKGYLTQLLLRQDLSRTEAQAAMGFIMSGQASESQISSFLTAICMKGVCSPELTGFADVMRQNSLRIHCRAPQVIDTCGTGGDSKGTFNVSTTVAFVLAGAGLTVAKHGNRGISSSCGSADVLTALGIPVDVSPQQVAQMIDEIGIGFLFAPQFHQAMKYAAKPRKDLGFRTVFNILGPLTNPALATCQVIGVYDKNVMLLVAETLLALGTERAMVVHSFDGMDEISSIEPTHVIEIKQGKIFEYVVQPEKYGFAQCLSENYKGGNPAENAQMLLAVLQGEEGPKRDIVLINAAAGLVVGNKAGNLEEGLELARKSIDSGAACGKLIALREKSRQLREAEELLS